MILCLSGAHRVGKTTLALKFAQEIGAEVLKFSISDIQKEIGFDSSNQSYSLDERLTVQEYVVSAMERIFATSDGRDMVCDRSPADVVAYTLIHVGEHTTPEQSKRINKIIERCAKVAELYCIGILLVQPGIPLVEENTTSAKCSEGFIEHLSSVCFGVINDERFSNVPMFFIPRSVTDLELRVKTCKDALTRAYVRSEKRIAAENERMKASGNIESGFFLGSALKN